MATTQKGAILNRFLVIFALALCSATAGAGLRHIRAAAEQGDPAMQLQLGELYQYGFGVKDHDVPALMWYLVAAHAGSAEAARRAAALAAAMPPAAVAQARARSATLIRKLDRHRSGIAPLQSPAPTP